MKVEIYVNYRGTCEQAFRFYEEHLGGRITSMARHGEQPNPEYSGGLEGQGASRPHRNRRRRC